MIGGIFIFLNSLGMAFLYGYENSMRNDHVYGDPDNPWDAYIAP
jgi:hypothetical protein